MEFISLRPAVDARQQASPRITAPERPDDGNRRDAPAKARDQQGVASSPERRSLKTGFQSAMMSRRELSGSK